MKAIKTGKKGWTLWKDGIMNHKQSQNCIRRCVLSRRCSTNHQDAPRLQRRYLVAEWKHVVIKSVLHPFGLYSHRCSCLPLCDSLSAACVLTLSFRCLAHTVKYWSSTAIRFVKDGIVCRSCYSCGRAWRAKEERCSASNYRKPVCSTQIFRVK